MKIAKRKMGWLGALLLWLAAAPLAQAFYNPTTGRWLSRDPIGEVSFQDSFLRAESPLGTAGLPLFALSLIERTLAEGEYAFIRNQPVSLADYLGLLPANQATRTIPDCAIEIYAGHGYLNSAFDDDGKLNNPNAVDRLKYPHILKGTKCSAGTIIACNSAKFASVENGITGVSLDDSQINVAQGINAIASSVTSAKAHAESICKSCPSCKEVTISVKCFPPFSTPGIFTVGSSLCGETMKIPCKCNTDKPKAP